MSRYAIAVCAEAARTLLRATSEEQLRLSRAIDELAALPRPMGVSVLPHGRGYLRIRVGRYRVVYHLDGDRLVIAVIRDRLSDSQDAHHAPDVAQPRATAPGPDCAYGDHSLGVTEGT